MKKIKEFLFLFIIIFVLLFAQLANAQTTVNTERQEGALLVSFPSITVDGTATVYSNWFAIKGFYTTDFSSKKINYTKLLTSVAGLPRITTTIEGSNDLSNIFTVATLGIAADSIETAQKGVTDFGSSDNSNKFLYYRYKHVGTSGNPSDTQVQETLLFTE